MRLHSIDFNLLRVLRMVYVTRNVTRAAERLFMTQSAVSNSLRRLREQLQDPLFIRTAEGMLPTPLVESVIGPIESGFSNIETAFRNICTFDPFNSDRLFCLLANDLAQMVFVPPMLRHLATVAPHIRLETLDVSLEEAKRGMSEGLIDIAIGNWPIIGADYHRKNLLSENFVVLMSRSNGLANQPLTAAAYLKARHVDYRPRGESYSALMRGLNNVLAAKGTPREIAFTAGHGLGLASIIADSDLLLTMPSRLANAMTTCLDTLIVKPLPYQIPQVTIAAQWHARLHHDPAAIWFREQVFTLFTNDSPRFEGRMDRTHG